MERVCFFLPPEPASYSNSNYCRLYILVWKAVFTFGILITAGLCRGQQVTVDSLARERLALSSDTALVINLSYSAFAYVPLNIDSALSIGNRAMDMARKLDFQSGIASCYNTLGWIYYNRGDDRKGIEYIQRSIGLQKELNNEKDQIISVYNLSSIYIGQRNYGDALDCLLRAIPLADKFVDSRSLSTGIYKNLAIVYRELKDYDLAIRYFEKAIRLNLKQRNLQLASNIKVSLAILYARVNNYPSAFREINEAYAISKKLGDVYGVSIATENKGDFYFQQKKYDAAMRCFQKARAGYEELGNRPDMAFINMEIGRVYAVKGDLGRAEAYLKSALRLAEAARSRNYLQDVYGALSEAYEKKGDFASSLKYYKHAVLLKDSLQTEAQQEKLNRLRTRYESEQKDKQIALLTTDRLLEAQKSRQRMLVFCIIILFVSTLVVLGYNRNNLLKKRNIISQQGKVIAEQQQAETEEKLLRAQMNPHFIFNSLNTIDSFVLQNKGREASRLIQRFSKLSRQVLDFTSRTAISVREETELLRIFLQIEQTRQEGKFDFKIDVERDMLLDAQIPPMLIQPFVENAILHGIRHRNGSGGLISVSIAQEEKKLKFTVEDNGIGRQMNKIIKEGQQKAHHSRAMDITRIRLAGLHHHNRSDEYVRFTDFQGTKTGTRVEIYIPMVFSEHPVVSSIVS
jgi:tetratricopeptide (TPR) repeat protein